jgi:RNA polymerase sigma-70 factor (ECF subfamily)
MSSVEGGDGDGHDGAMSFSELYRGHWTSLCHYVARNFGAGPPDPEDIAQQAFERLLGSVNKVENVGPFLRRTARNLVIDHYRAALRTANVMTSKSILEAGHNDLSPEDVLSSKRELMILNGVIATLPARERVALLMHRIDGASFVEIAAHLGVSHSGARLLVARAFERCAGAMEKQP